jgi:hypothetical protein
MPHDIIDNRTRELAPEINNFLADSIRTHFAVGYFFLSGFQAIAEHMPALLSALPLLSDHGKIPWRAAP